MDSFRTRENTNTVMIAAITAGLKSGAALAVPDRYFADDAQRDELIALLAPQKTAAEE